MQRKKKKEKVPKNPLDKELKKFKGAGLGPFQPILEDESLGKRGKPLAVDSPDLDRRPIDADLPTHKQKQAFFGKQKLAEIKAKNATIDTIYGETVITAGTVGFYDKHKHEYTVIPIPRPSHITGDIDVTSIKLSAKKDYIIGEFIGKNSKTGQPYQSVWMVDVLSKTVKEFPGGIILLDQDKLQIHDVQGRVAMSVKAFGIEPQVLPKSSPPG
ncbi:MAG: hypothetical protein ACYCQI_15895 [Gammaproteobacteria bacterium]